MPGRRARPHDGKSVIRRLSEPTPRSCVAGGESRQDGAPLGAKREEASCKLQGKAWKWGVMVSEKTRPTTTTDTAITEKRSPGSDGGQGPYRRGEAERRTSEGGDNNSNAKRMGGKGREKPSPFQPAGHGKHTRRAEKPRDPAMLGQGGRGVEDFSPPRYAKLWAAWACGNPHRIRLLSWFRVFAGHPGHPNSKRKNCGGNRG